MAQSRQKSYTDKGDHVLLKVTTTIGAGRRLKVKKHNPRFVGPFLIVQIIGLLAYMLALPPFMSSLHGIFHVSQLKKYVPNPYQI